jgi:hypothetical protein
VQVGSFTEMDPKQLLLETEKAMAGTKLYCKPDNLPELHQELIRMQE